MNAQHTPGPWSWTLVRIQRDIHGPNGQAVCYTRGGRWSGGTDDATDGANARLIAAAPDLLAELQAAHKLLQLALKHMGGERQSLFATESERLGFGVDGATRHHERAAVIARATGAAL